MKDKKYHVLAGLLVSAFVGLPAYLESLNLFAGLWSAIVSGILLAVCKEWCDNNTEGNRWNWIELLMTVVGGVLVALFIVLLHYGKG